MFFQKSNSLNLISNIVLLDVDTNLNVLKEINQFESNQIKSPYSSNQIKSPCSNLLGFEGQVLARLTLCS